MLNIVKDFNKTTDFLPVLMQRLADINIRHHITINQHKVRAHKILCIYIPEHISQWAVQVWRDDVDCVWRGGSTPLWLPVRQSVRSNSVTELKLHKSSSHTVLLKRTASDPWFCWPSSSRRRMFLAPQWMWGTPVCSRSWQSYPAAAKPDISDNVTHDVSRVSEVTVHNGGWPHFYKHY